PAPPVRSFAFLRLLGSVLADRDVCFAILGATGWLGQATLEILETALGPQSMERVIAFGSRSREIKLRTGRSVRIHSLDNLVNLADEMRYVFLHYAFLARDKVATYSFDDYIAAND